MLDLTPAIAIVKPADLITTPIAIPADDFPVYTDAEWEALYEASIASDWVCSGIPL